MCVGEYVRVWVGVCVYLTGTTGDKINFNIVIISSQARLQRAIL